MEFNLRADRIKPRDWAAARDWTLSIAAMSTAAVEEEERRQDAISANKARYERHWALVAERRKAEAGGG